MRALAIFFLGVGCSSGTSSGDCASIRNEIHDAAIKRGYDGDKNGIPDDKGICEDTTTPGIQRDFANACAKLRSCEQ